jgi:PAS domain S-box-containing protein
MTDQPLSFVAPELSTSLDKPWYRDAFIDASHRLANLGYCEWDYAHGRIISCTPHYAEIFGMSVEEVIESQSTWDKVLQQLHPDDHERYARSHEQHLGAGTHEIEYRIFRKDGAIRHIREVGIVFFDANGKPDESMGLLQDITEQKERIQDLETRDEMARQVETVTEIGHFIWDMESENYIYVSPGYLRILGLNLAQHQKKLNSLGDYLADVHPDDRDSLAEDYRVQREEVADMVTEYRLLVGPGDYRWIREKSTVVKNSASGADQAIGVIQDITEHKQSEHQLRQAKASLEAEVEERTRKLSQTVARLNQEIAERKIIATELEIKNSELERFTYTVSHDLKSPLVTIKGFLGLLEKDIDANDHARVAEDIERLKSATDTMGTLLNDLLELSRVGRVMGEPVICSLDDIAACAVELVRSELDALGIEIDIDDLPQVRGDETRLVEVLLNLIENSIKFMGEQQNPRIHIAAESRDDMVCCTVSDNGVGIAKPYQEQVFDLFERLNADVDGTGIGLALVKRIVETHGGRIWVESAGPGTGCSMCFTLPAPRPD